MRRSKPVLLAVTLALVSTSRVARADGPYEGTWNAGPTRIEVDVRSWGPDCGPRPQPTTVPSPGNVRVTQAGDQLTFHGRQVAHTDRCWSENRAVRRVSSSYQSGVWRTVCRTPEEDARGETGTYTLRAAGDDRLEFVDVSRYDWQLTGSRCVATITSRQAFTRIRQTAPAKTERPTEEAASRCTPGAPARLRVTPSSATIEPGQQQQFRARVLDASGCAVPRQTIRWDLRRPASARGELEDGLFQAAATAAEAEGEFTVVARAGSLHDQATVVVRTADLSDLIARRTAGGLVQASEEDATSESVSGVVARHEASEGSLLGPLLGVAAALILLGGAAWLLLVRRRQGGRSGSPVPAGQASAEAPSGRMAVASGTPPTGGRHCPVCHKTFDDPHVVFCPVDGAQLLEPGAAPAGQALICPVCRRGFAEGERVCPRDQEELVPYALFVERHRRQEAGTGERTKICPKCGDRYALTVTFCGKDGAELVLVN